MRGQNQKRRSGMNHSKTNYLSKLKDAVDYQIRFEKIERSSVKIWARLKHQKSFQIAKKSSQIAQIDKNLREDSVNFHNRDRNFLKIGNLSKVQKN